MPRGLGKLQRAILEYLNYLPSGGGLYGSSTGSGNVLTGFKQQHYPHLYGPDRPYYDAYYNYNDNGTGLSESEYKKGMGKARVAMHLAVKALIARGYIRLEKGYLVPTDELYYKAIYITESGKKIINQ